MWLRDWKYGWQYSILENVKDVVIDAMGGLQRLLEISFSLQDIFMEGYRNVCEYLEHYNS